MSTQRDSHKQCSSSRCNSSCVQSAHKHNTSCYRHANANVKRSVIGRNDMPRQFRQLWWPSQWFSHLGNVSENSMHIGLAPQQVLSKIWVALTRATKPLLTCTGHTAMLINGFDFHFQHGVSNQSSANHKINRFWARGIWETAALLNAPYGWRHNQVRHFMSLTVILSSIRQWLQIKRQHTTSSLRRPPSKWGAAIGDNSILMTMMPSLGRESFGTVTSHDTCTITCTACRVQSNHLGG